MLSMEKQEEKYIFFYLFQFPFNLKKINKFFDENICRKNRIYNNYTQIIMVLDNATDIQ